jgi:hypothetical protein
MQSPASIDKVLVLHSYFMRKVQEMCDDETVGRVPEPIEKLLQWSGVDCMFRVEYVALPCCTR